jgi:hypothetical protein
MRRLGSFCLFATTAFVVLEMVSDMASGRPLTEGCDDLGPVLDTSLRGSGDWRLPLSSERPDQLTHAQIGMEIRPPGERHRPWIAIVRVEFPDPKPFGIPYSFEKLELQWNRETEASAVLDWSEGCSGPGRSVFPGQSWLQEWEIPGTEELPWLHEARLRVWGSRN